MIAVVGFTSILLAASNAETQLRLPTQAHRPCRNFCCRRRNGCCCKSRGETSFRGAGAARQYRKQARRQFDSWGNVG